MRALGQQRFSAPGRLRRRVGFPHGHELEDERPWPGQLHDEHRFSDPRVSLTGAWLSYGLGTLGDNLPTFVVLPDPKGLPYNAKGNFTAGFLPMSHQGTILDAAAARPIPDLFAPVSAGYITPASEREGLENWPA